MNTVIWFPVSPDEEMREAADEMITWLDNAKFTYKWLGKGEVIAERFCVSISFPDQGEAAIARLTWA